MSSPSRVAFAGALALLAAAAGCGRSDGQGSGELRQNLGMDLAKVAGFVVTRGAAAATSGAAAYHPQDDGALDGGAASQLYALHDDGSLTVVTVTGDADAGTSSSTEQPLAVFSTPLYVIIAYLGVQHGQDRCNFVAARKQDGALYCVTAPNTGFTQYEQRGAAYGSLVQSDATGHLVWINHDSGVTLVDFTNPDAVAQTTPAGTEASNPSGPPDGPFGLAVNHAGDALVTDINPAHFTRVFFPGGGFFNVSDAMENCLMAGPAASPDGFVYTTDGPTTIVKLAKAGATTFTKTAIASSEFIDCPAGAVQAGAHLFLTTSTPPANRLLDVAGDPPQAIAVDGLVKLHQVGACGEQLFILGADESGNGGIVRADLGSLAFTTLVAPGAYALTTMAVSPGCEVTFYGQRAADGAFILGTILAGSDAVTVDATGFPAVTQIERIN